MMNETSAAAHSGYLDRYKNTGEAHVIGKLGRNVTGKKRNGDEFPLAIFVQEIFIENEK